MQVERKIEVLTPGSRGSSAGTARAAAATQRMRRAKRSMLFVGSGRSDDWSETSSFIFVLQTILSILGENCSVTV